MLVRCGGNVARMDQEHPMASSANTPIVSNATPQTMAAAGVPFHLARWYHVIGRHLTQLTDWDRDLITDLRMRLAQSGL